MNTIKIKAGAHVTLDVKISSDANVGSNVSINDKVVKKSIENHFTVALDNTKITEGGTLSVVSNFFVQGDAIDAIMNTTTVELNIVNETVSIPIETEKAKVSSELFTVYAVAKFEKK